MAHSVDEKYDGNSFPGMEADAPGPEAGSLPVYDGNVQGASGRCEEGVDEGDSVPDVPGIWVQEEKIGGSRG